MISGARGILPGPRLARRAQGLDRPRLHVERELARVPHRDVNARVLAVAVRPEERRDERARQPERRRDERVLAESNPLALSREGGRDERLDGLGRPADLGVDVLVVREVDRAAEIVGDVARGVLVSHHGRPRALQVVERGERDRLDVLHAHVADEVHHAHAIDGPGDEVAGARLLLAGHAYPARSLDRAAAARVDHD